MPLKGISQPPFHEATYARSFHVFILTRLTSHQQGLRVKEFGSPYVWDPATVSRCTDTLKWPELPHTNEALENLAPDWWYVTKKREKVHFVLLARRRAKLKVIKRVKGSSCGAASLVKRISHILTVTACHKIVTVATLSIEGLEVHKTCYWKVKRTTTLGKIFFNCLEIRSFPLNCNINKKKKSGKQKKKKPVGNN